MAGRLLVMRSVWAGMAGFGFMKSVVGCGWEDVWLVTAVWGRVMTFITCSDYLLSCHTGLKFLKGFTIIIEWEKHNT